MSKEINEPILAQAKTLATGLLILLPGVKASFQEAGIDENGRRLVTTLEGELSRLVQQVNRAARAYRTSKNPESDAGPGLAALYGVWQGVDISEKDIEDVKFRSKEF